MGPVQGHQCPYDAPSVAEHFRKTGTVNLNPADVLLFRDSLTWRVRLRITSREKVLHAKRLDFQLSPVPDRFGRLDFLWESLPWHEEGADLPDSFQDVTLGIGGTHEAFVYFRMPDKAPVLPPESLVVLWYGSRMFELPILLSPS